VAYVKSPFITCLNLNEVYFVFASAISSELNWIVNHIVFSSKTKYEFL